MNEIKIYKKCSSKKISVQEKKEEKIHVRNEIDGEKFLRSTNPTKKS